MKFWALLVLCSAAFAASAAPAQLLDLSAEEVSRIASHGPWPPPREIDPSNRVDGQRAAMVFGQALFFDTRLSATRRQSCAHDSLWAASLAPLLSPAEMGQTFTSIAALVRGSPQLAASYRQAFARAPGTDDERLGVDAAKALAAFIATLASPRTAFDDFRDALLRGDRAAAARYPVAAQRGLRLFIGSARCAVCHAGAAFSNGEFADIGRPFFITDGVDPGRYRGLQKLLASPMNRLGPHDDAGSADPRASRRVIC